jgi:hypothetical protein
MLSARADSKLAALVMTTMSPGYDVAARACSLFVVAEHSTSRRDGHFQPELLESTAELLVTVLARVYDLPALHGTGLKPV